MALSTNTYIYTGGAQTFPVNFSLGFIQRSDVQVRVNGAVDGGGDPVYSTFDWIDDSNITVTAALTNGDSVEVLRTVSKTELKVDFSTTADVTPSNLDLSAKHGLMVYQELVDGRVDGTESPIVAADRSAAQAVISTTKAAEAAASAAAAAASAAAALASEGATVASSDVTYNQGGTGAIDRTLETKLRERVSCADFGRTKETVDQLQYCDGATEGSYIETLGYYVAGDGGGGMFFWDADSVAADNGGTVIKATAITTGRWLRVYSSSVFAKWFGAKGDGATNDTIAIQGAESVIGVTEIYLTEGTYIVTSYTLTKTYRGEGFISVDGIVQRQNSDWNDLQPNGGRSLIRYYDYNDVFVIDKHFTMSEFRVAGQYTRIKAPSWSTTDNTTLISTDTNTFGSMVKHASNWYGAFACANEGDATVSTQATPFLRARSVAGSVVTLGYAGIGDDELGPIPVAATYTWTPSELVGTKVLVVSEGTLVGKLNILGSRVTTITAATTTTITLADVGSIGVRDYLLPAPSGFEFFKYLGSVYRDTHEIFNIYDSGSLVMNRGVANANFTNNYQGSQPTTVAIKVGGYIPPLATAVVLHTKYTIASASTGDIVENFGGDTSHMTDIRYEGKYNTGNQSVRHSNITVPFLWRQEYAYSNGGSLAGIKGYDEHYPWGWIEN